MNCRTFTSPWGNEDTQTLIDILERYNVKTTFFVVGDWAEKYPESVKALHDAGHEVMSHSNHHDHYNSLTAQQIIDDVTASNERISAVTGVTPTLIRCPYGEYDDHVIAAIRSMGMEPIQWDVDSLDWKDYDADTICKRVTSRVQPGSIVLFHNAALHTPEALPAILTRLINDGYTVVPISQLILEAPYTIDHTGRQFPAETTPAEQRKIIYKALAIRQKTCYIDDSSLYHTKDYAGYYDKVVHRRALMPRIRGALSLSGV